MKNNTRIKIIISQGIVKEEHELWDNEVSLITRKWIKTRLDYLDKLQQANNAIVPHFCSPDNDPGNLSVCLNLRTAEIVTDTEPIKLEDFI